MYRKLWQSERTAVHVVACR